MYPFKYWCFDLLPFDCLVELYLRGVADGTKSLKINDHFTLSKNIPRRRGVVWSEQINHFGHHTNTEVGDFLWMTAMVARCERW